MQQNRTGQDRTGQDRNIVLTSKGKMQRKIALLLAIIMALSVHPVHMPLDVTATGISAGASILHVQNVESSNIISRFADALPSSMPHNEHMFTDNLIASSLLNTMHTELATLNTTQNQSAHMTTALPLTTTSPLTAFTGDGFTVNIVNHSSWATGHNTMFEITNTSSEVWYHWVFSVNRNLGLNIPTSWGTSWQNNGLFVHQDNSETTIRNLGHQAPVAPGESIQIHTYSNTTPFHMPTDFRVRPAERRPIPSPDYTYQVLEHSEWLGQFFHHAIVWNNTTNPWRIIQNWEIEFDITGGGMYIDSVPNASVMQLTSQSAILAYVPGDGQVMHPDQNMHLGMIGTFVPGSSIPRCGFMSM